ncbi:phosphopentomutase [Anaeroplasma bactoclasticum]|jgi:phosphopentomutase|uniref:Phosphopentomutase n=1 Tax=Anaeroplasma bactoclasticum TaxID=2088 RepID=A0A397RTB1_9MOLU|nr:phosphopentomutase [Anaeroplasma bactoclasticum]RIA75976.1 phosphopentomutase [Anaeroplasma bactoclasticum]
MFKRIFVIVADSLGCGTAPRSAEFGDEGANTIAHIAEHEGGIKLPVMESMGYGNITDIKGVKKVNNPKGYYGRMDEASNGKDTMTGHWEMMGILTENPFKTFTDTGFPKELIDELEAKTGHKVIGNCAASGTEILKDLGLEHIKTGAMIVYTSADSVLQIACHEEHFGLDELYRCCEIAREICMKPEWMVGRIIARPFLGETKDTFKRTTNRHDYALSPTSRTTLDELKDKGYSVVSIGKIKDIFNGCGITEAYKNLSNHNGMEHAFEVAKHDFTGLVFSNLVDFDALYGHRRDPKGYHDAIEEFDSDLKTLMDLLNDDDLLMVTADHGNDPTWTGTDHTREYVPILVWSKSLKGGSLGTRKSFADIGATIAENFNVKAPDVIGESFLSELK